MTIDRFEIKRGAKELVFTAMPRPMMVALVYMLASLLIGYLGGRISGSPYSVDLEAVRTGTALWDAVAFTPENVRPLGAALDLVMQLLSTVLSTGFTIYCLCVSRRIAAGYANLLDGFGIFLRVIWMRILVGLFTALWTLLFVIPGLIAAYGYRQAVYLMLDHPDWSCLRCIRESKALMRGHKWELFVLDLSFLGWALLTGLFFPVYVYVLPFMELSYAEYYNRLTGVSAAPGPEDAQPGGKPPWEY